MKRSIKAFCLLGIVLISVLFCGAVNEENYYEDHMSLCRAMIDAVVADDRAAAQATVIPKISEQEFDQVYRGLRSLWSKMEKYAIVAEEQGHFTENGVTYYKTVFKVTSEDGAVYLVSCVTEPGGKQLAGFHATLSDLSEAAEEVPFLLQALFLLLTLACVAFSVWMTVDCARRKIKLKWLWILLCWLSAGFTLTFAASNVGLYFRFGLVFLPSMATLRSGIFALQLYLPVGAIIYFFMRKKLSAKAEQETVAYYAQPNFDFTVEEPQNVETPSEEQDPPAEE